MYEINSEAQIDSYCVIPVQIFYTPEFRQKRIIKFPDCVLTVGKFYEMKQRNSMFGIADPDFGFNKAFQADMWLGSMMNMDSVAFRTIQWSVWDQLKKFTLVDISSNPTIFQSQLEYQVLRTIGKSEWQGFLECRYLTLDTDHQKIFNAKLSAWDDPSKRPVGLKYSIVGRDEEKNFEYLMINIWENKDDYIAWKNEKENELKDFGHGGNKQPIVTEFTILG